MRRTRGGVWGVTLFSPRPCLHVTAALHSSLVALEVGVIRCPARRIALGSRPCVRSPPFRRNSRKMARDVVDLTPIESRDELVAWFAEGAKPKAQWRVGTEHEKFAFTTDTHDPVPYESRVSIRSLLVGMQHLLGWEPILDGGNIIGLADVTGGGAISLEPGGQFRS